MGLGISLCPAEIAHGLSFDSRFQVDEGNVLGTGKFSTVYMCFRRGQPNRRFALKAISTYTGDNASLARIYEEIAIMRVIEHHQSIIRLIEMDESTPNTIRLVLELCEGGELYDRIQQKRFFSEADTKVLIKNLLEAVAFIHSKGIMHRDLKPENILLVSKVSNTEIKVSDFGLAKLSKDYPRRLPRSTSICGSDFYLAPEVIKQEACIKQVLQSLVGPGDLLSSDLRADFAAEALAAWGECQGCIHAKLEKLPAKGVNFAKYNQEELIEHDFVTEGPFRDLAHAIVNRQQKLDETFFNTVIDRLKDFHGNGSSGYSDDDFKAMAVELNTIAALCAGIRAFCAASNMEVPQLPAKPVPSVPAHFKSVSEYSTGPLQTVKSVAWGPYLPTGQLKQDVLDRFGIDGFLMTFAGDKPTGPTSKASAVPLTCWEFLKFMDVMYVPIVEAPRFLKVPGTDRTLNRGQLEIAAAEYTTGKAHISMQTVAETALLGGFHPLHDEIGALARAVANPENMEKIAQTRKDLLAKSNEYGREIDVWAVGVITFVVLSGALPFFNQILHKLYRQIVERDVSFSDQRWKTVSAGAQDFILRLLQVRAGDRLTAEQALLHPWLRTVTTGSFASESSQSSRRGAVQRVQPVQPNSGGAAVPQGVISPTFKRR